MILRNVLIIALGFQIMVYMTRPIITLYASQLGASTLEVGILTAAYAFLPFIFAIHAGKIVDQIGDRLPVILGLAGTTLGLAIPFFFPAMWSLYVSQAIVGVSYVFINVPLQNILGNAATPQNRDHYFSMLSMMVALAGVIGPVAGGYLGEHVSYTSVFLVAVLLGLFPILFSLAIPARNQGKAKEKDQKPASDSGLLALLRVPLIRKTLASSALVLYSRDIFVAYFPLYADQLGISASAIGWIIAIQGISMVAVRFFLGRMTDAFGRSHILLGSILLAGIAFLAIPLSQHLILFGLFSALMGAGLGCGQPLSMTTAYNASPKSRTGEVLGLRLATNRLSQLIAPVLFGLVGSWVGLMSIFWVSGAFLIGGAFLTHDKSGESATEEEAGMKRTC